MFLCGCYIITLIVFDVVSVLDENRVLVDCCVIYVYNGMCCVSDERCVICMSPS